MPRVTQATLDRARDGDQAAFAALVEPMRRELHVHCYRMLGSVTDAEDLLQETLTAAWRGIGGLAEPSALRAWLYRIATNRCLNAIRSHKRRQPPTPEPAFEVPSPSRHREVTWLQPYPDEWLAELPDPAPGPATHVELADTMRLAFVEVLQRMPPRQAAALLLVDVLHFTREEVADMLGVSSTALKGLLQRARRALPSRPSDPSETRPEDEDVAGQFASAFATDDVDRMIALLTDGAWLAMPPAPHEYHGKAAILRFLAARANRREPSVVQVSATRTNRQPAFLLHWNHGVISLLCVTTRSGKVDALWHFLEPNLRG
jgi:RNA polymerase sigma-70 factor (TIGR02960 family)